MSFPLPDCSGGCRRCATAVLCSCVQAFRAWCKSVVPYFSPGVERSPGLAKPQRTLAARATGLASGLAPVVAQPNQPRPLQASMAHFRHKLRLLREAGKLGSVVGLARSRIQQGKDGRKEDSLGKEREKGAG